MLRSSFKLGRTLGLGVGRRVCCQMSTTSPTLQSYEEIPLADSFEELHAHTGGRINFATIAEFLCEQTDGGLVRSGASLLGKEMLWAFDREDIREVIRQEGSIPSGAGAGSPHLLKYNTEKVDGDMWAFSLGKQWKEGRMEGQKHLFGTHDAKKFLPVINQTSKRIALVFEEEMKESVNTSRIIQATTLEYIYGVLFGLNPGVLDGTCGNKEKAYLETVRRFFEVAFYKLQIDPNEVKKLISGETSELYLEFESLLDEIIEYGQEMSLQVVENVKNGTTDDQMMNSYVAQQYLSNPDISTRKLAVNAAIMLAAGVDTTSQMITMILTRLAENQDLQDQVALQINQISKGGDGGLVYEEKDQYSLLKACMREISRLTPVTGGFMREIAYPISIRGFDIPENTPVACVPSVGLRTKSGGEKFWEDWNEYNPNRWDEVISKERKRRGQESPLGLCWSGLNISTFGRGSHMCVGARVAELEIFSFFHEILSKYRLKATWDPKNPPYSYDWNTGIGAYHNIPVIDVEKR